MKQMTLEDLKEVLENPAIGRLQRQPALRNTALLLYIAAPGGIDELLLTRVGLKQECQLLVMCGLWARGPKGQGYSPATKPKPKPKPKKGKKKTKRVEVGEVKAVKRETVPEVAPEPEPETLPELVLHNADHGPTDEPESAEG